MLTWLRVHVIMRVCACMYAHMYTYCVTLPLQLKQPTECIGARIREISRVGQNHVYTVYTQNDGEWHLAGVHTVLLAGESPNIRSYTVCLYGSGQP